jgi:hypothetical protein
MHGDVSVVEVWKERFMQGSAEAADLEADLRKLDTEIDGDEKALQTHRAALELGERDLNLRKRERDALAGLWDFLTYGQVEPTVEPASPNTNGAASHRSRRAAVRTLLSKAQDVMSVAEIRNALITDGVIEDTPSAGHALHVTLSQMFRKDMLERPKMGYYRLPPGTAVQSSTREAV